MPEQTLNRQDESVWSKLLSQLPRLILTWILVSYVANMFLSPKNDIPLPVPPDDNSADKAKPPTIIQPIYRLGDKLDLYFYLNDQDHFLEFDNSEKLLLLEKNITFGDYNDVRAKDFKLPCDARLQNNGSLYAHFFIVKAGTTLGANADKDTLLYHRKSLARLMPPRKNVKRKNLIKGANEKETIPEPISKDWIRYWWPNVTLAIVTADTPLGTNMPPQIMKKLQLASTKTKYKPIFYTNDFWMLQEALIPINNTVESLDVYFTFSPMSMWKFQLYVQFEESFRLQVDVMGLDVAEHDQMKKMFTDTNPVLLGVTFLVSLLHSIFDFLAFKNDISFWKEKKNMEGLSFRSILLNVGFQFVILLYLLDNDTSYLVCISTGMGLLIEIWKINKAVKVKAISTFPYVAFLDRGKPSELESKTKEYDRMAFGYLSYVFFPLMVCYTIYSVIYEQHKSWYSFVIGTLVGFVYTFGFISMTPQLFINYKLKSIAHMPWRTLMYKSLNTFVDDLFAFVIKMPWLHRLACLRDDVIFFVYLYQRWIYPEDKRRRNEFGQIGKDDDSNQLDPGQKISGDEVEINHENTSIATAISDDSKLRKRAANKRK